ncbi:hypothetical protein [Brevibacillus sp. MS2.2]|uniref:hypothetical protein n=1 Tax=Brevibacillus sp. MS2.2 TaxID=2738981 RepID=UPI00156B4CA8|nr:hypothetical protein [Brevibacillus sp. MS2.2]NRR24826.1 hypothetical protein [Brevibacillus sp. MS2.2]
MEAFSLPVEPFNGTWINCVNNNLISILMNHDKNFEYTPCLAETKYQLHSLEEDARDETTENKSQAHEDGMLLLDVVRVLDLSSVLDFQTYSFAKEESGHPAIKEFLRNGYYVFVDLDRFYYPSGVDSEKQHIVHPAFLYGYNEETKSYLLIEDCMQPSKMEKYMLPYDCFDRAFASAQAPSLLAARIKEQEEQQFFSRCTKELIKGNLHSLLLEERTQIKGIHSENSPIYTAYGLSVIQRFADSIEQRLLGISLPNFQRKAVAIKNPYFFRKSTIHLPLILYKNNWVNETAFDQLTSEYKKLCHDWELYGNTLIKLYYKFSYSRGANQSHQSEMESLRELLMGMCEKEKRVTSFTLELLT